MPTCAGANCSGARAAMATAPRWSSQSLACWPSGSNRWWRKRLTPSANMRRTRRKQAADPARGDQAGDADCSASGPGRCHDGGNRRCNRLVGAHCARRHVGYLGQEAEVDRDLGERGRQREGVSCQPIRLKSDQSRPQVFWELSSDDGLNPALAAQNTFAIKSQTTAPSAKLNLPRRRSESDN